MNDLQMKHFKALQAFRFEHPSEILDFTQKQYPRLTIDFNPPSVERIPLNVLFYDCYSKCDLESENRFAQHVTANAVKGIKNVQAPENGQWVRAHTAAAILAMMAPATLHACLIALKGILPEFEKSKFGTALDTLGRNFKSNALPAARERAAVFEKGVREGKKNLDDRFEAAFRLHRALSAHDYREHLTNICGFAYEARFYQTAIEIHKYLREQGRWL